MTDLIGTVDHDVADFRQVLGESEQPASTRLAGLDRRQLAYVDDRVAVEMATGLFHVLAQLGRFLLLKFPGAKSKQSRSLTQNLCGYFRK